MIMQSSDLVTSVRIINKCSILTLPLKQLKAIVLSMRSFLWRIKCVHCCLLYPLLFQRPWLKEDATDALCGGEKKQASFEIRVKRRKEEKKGGDALTCCTQRAGEVLQKERRGEVREEWCDQGKQFFFFFYRVGWRERKKKRKMVGRSTPKVTPFTVIVVQGDASVSPPEIIILILFFYFDKSLFLLHMRTIHTFLRTKT